MTQDQDVVTDINTLLSGDFARCQQLLTSCFTGSGTGSTDPQQLLAHLAETPVEVTQTLLVSLQLQFSPQAALDPDSYALAAFVDQLFNNYYKNIALHPQLHAAINGFRLPALVSLCRGQLPWLDRHSPIQVFPDLIPAIIGWQPELGRAADRFLDALSTHLTELTSSHDQSDRDRAEQRLRQFLERERQRIDKLERRLRDAEIGQLHARHAQQLSARALNQQMGGKRLPVAISRFLKGPWRESMRLVILAEGNDSEAWRRIVRLTETLIWTFQPLDDDESGERRQHIYQSISELSEQMRETVVGLHHSSELDRELAAVEAEHLKILKGQALDYQPFDLIDNTNPLASARISVSNNLIRQIEKFGEGQWFIYHGDDEEQRIKLSIKIDQAQQLLFTNFIGIKSRQFNYEEFAYLLSSRTVVPLNRRDIFQSVGEKVLQSLQRHYEQQQRDRDSARAAERELQQQQAATRQQAREKALEEARAYARAAEATRRKAQAESKPATPPPPAAETGKQAAEQINRIRPGARLAFRNEAMEEYTCRLAAILQTNGQYIFVNNAGVKQHALDKQELTELCKQGKARVIDLGSDINSTLEQVVNNFRARKQP